MKTAEGKSDARKKTTTQTRQLKQRQKVNKNNARNTKNNARNTTGNLGDKNKVCKTLTEKPLARHNRQNMASKTLTERTIGRQAREQRQKDMYRKNA